MKRLISQFLVFIFIMALFAVALLGTVKCAEGEGLLTVFVCNYLDTRIFVHINNAEKNSSYKFELILEPVSAMGKGGYQYRPPNVAKLRMPPGAYLICWKKEKAFLWKTQIIEIIKNLTCLDFEDDA